MSESVLGKDTIKQVAHLARLDLAPAELEKLSGQLEDILEFIGKLKALDIHNVAPTSHILPLSNIAREDTARGSLPTDQALLNAPHKSGDFFGVPKVIE